MKKNPLNNPILYTLYLVTILVILGYFWNTIYVYPFKLFTVLLHESGHAFAAILTGGKVYAITLNQMLGGTTMSSGGNCFIILPAGYLGSMFFGSLILYFNKNQNISKVLSIITLIITILFVRNPFGLGFCFVIILILWFIKNKILVDIFGIASVGYALIDIKEDLVDRTVPSSDAYVFSQMFTGNIVSPVIIGIVWGILSILYLFFFIKILIKKK